MADDRRYGSPSGNKPTPLAAAPASAGSAGGPPSQLDPNDFPELDKLFEQSAVPGDDILSVQEEVEDQRGEVEDQSAPEPASAASERAEMAPPEEPPPPPAAAEPSILDDHDLFRAEANRLARARDWQTLAGIMSAALDAASWARFAETRAALLVDLARIHRDRLSDPGSAEDTFRRLLEKNPAHPEANQFLAARYRERGDWRALHDLRAGAIDATWDPQQRMEWTRECVSLATERLHEEDLAAAAWERLLRLGDWIEEASAELSVRYRRLGIWEPLARFLEDRAAAASGPARMVVLRELCEVYLSALRNQDQAQQVIDRVFAEAKHDAIGLLAHARVLARTRDWDALAELGTRKLEDLPAAAVADVRRVVADALAGAEEFDRAATVYEHLLAADPTDAEALAAREQHLIRSGRTDELVALLKQRAEKARSATERGDLLVRAAELADRELGDLPRAIALWEERAGIDEGRLEALQALASMHERTGDSAGVTRALEAQLPLVRGTAVRMDLLRRIGEHCAHRAGDDTRAQSCWSEVLAIVPDDATVRDELLALYRRRGDHEALDRMLTREGWRTIDSQAALGFWRSAAGNLQEHSQDANRTVRALLRIVDLAPEDPEVLASLVAQHRARQQGRDLIDTLSAQMRADRDESSTIARATEVARLCESEGDAVGALAAYERVLALQPANEAALSQLARLYGPTGAGTSFGLYEVAAASIADPQARASFLGEARALLPAEDGPGRFYHLRRLLWLSGAEPSLLEELRTEAAKTGTQLALASTYQTLACEATDDATRAAYHRELATVYERHLKDPVRAFLALQSIGQRSIQDLGELEAAAKLARATKRHEDLLALLDVVARVEAPLATRQSALRERARICEDDLADGERAFFEQWRLLSLDPHDEKALAEARRLAAAVGLWRELDALYAEMSDRSVDADTRISIARARYDIHRNQLKNAETALDRLLVLYRLSSDRDLEKSMIAAAKELDAWDRVLPLIAAHAFGDPEALVACSKLEEQKRKDKSRAYDLLAQAFILTGGGIELEQNLNHLAHSTKQTDRMTYAYRFAAARAVDPMRAIALFEHVATAYASVERPGEAIDVHRRILQLDPMRRESLEVVIAHLQKEGDPSELREHLRRWIDLAKDGETPLRIERLLEIARLSRAPLGDLETSLATYAEVLDLDPGNEEALQGIKLLTEGPMEPPLALRRMQLELRRAKGAERWELLLCAADLQEQELEDVEAATQTLRQLVTEAGVEGPGFDPLARLLRRRNRWAELLDLLEARAAAVAPERAVRLREAVALCDQHPAEVAAERCERLYQQILNEQPADADARQRLLGLYRAGARHSELADLLKMLAARASSAVEKQHLELELARVLASALKKPDEAEAIIAAWASARPDDPEVLLWLASLKQRRGDIGGYIECRERHATKLDPQMAALVLCHLAEACDEHGMPDRVLNFYRAARALDPANVCATEALKALGRRLKTWRASAALLADPEEAQLPWHERARRLCERGDSEAASNPSSARGFYQRAIAVFPDSYDAWDGLASVCAATGETDAVLGCKRSALLAYERATAPSPNTLATHAERLYELANLVRTRGDEAAATELAEHAYDVRPAFAPAALATATRKTATGEPAAARAIYDALLRTPSALSGPERLEALFRRGDLAARENRLDDAIADLREGLRIDGTHPGLLQALAEVLARRGRPASAAQHCLQSLVFVGEPLERARLYARLGSLLHDPLAKRDEAAVCYELAVSADLDDPQVLPRALRYLRESGRVERALATIDRLLPKTSDTALLGALWTERGELLLGRDTDKAIEAFDLALSYDPGHLPALDGLARALEKRGDWNQLLELLEARTDNGTAVERAEALRRLAAIADERLSDPGRARGYLERAVRLDPRKEDYEHLLKMVGEFAGPHRQEILGAMMLHTGPWMPHLIEHARRAAADGDRRLAWCLLSPLLHASIPDPATKTLVYELRRELEKVENLSALSPKTHKLVGSEELHPALMSVLAEVDQLVPLGPVTPDAAGAKTLGKLDGRTPAGKAMAALASALGIEGYTVTRADKLPLPYVILDTDTPQFVVRTELTQLPIASEMNFVFAMLLEQTRPGIRVLSSLGPETACKLVHAVLALSGRGEATGDVEPLVARVRELAGLETVARWTEALQYVPDEGRPVQVQAQRIVQAAFEATRRVGLIAAGELRAAIRQITRLDESLPRLQSAGRIEDLDTFIGEAGPVRSLVAFSVTPKFEKAFGAELD